MNDIARILILVGLAFLGFGVFLLVAGKIPGFGKFPGDIFIKKENFTFYFPITTSILLSIVLSLIFFLFNRR